MDAPGAVAFAVRGTHRDLRLDIDFDGGAVIRARAGTGCIGAGRGHADRLVVWVAAITDQRSPEAARLASRSLTVFGKRFICASRRAASERVATASW